MKATVAKRGGLAVEMIERLKVPGKSANGRSLPPCGQGRLKELAVHLLSNAGGASNNSTSVA
ncbi:MAG: hypothetical protein ACKOPM_16840 [Novosphingobium sp.]